jgi:RNA polymerase sigma-32 factor
LNEKEKYIYENRLMDDEPLTLQEIGNKFDISRERTRQIEENLKKKLKVALGNVAEL